MSNKRSLESNSTIINNNKFVVNNIKSSVSTAENKTPTDNLTTLTSTSESDHLHHKTQEEIFVKPSTTTHKKFIKRNNKTEQKFVRRPKYDRSKFTYLAPLHRISDSGSVSINDKCKEQQQDFVNNAEKEVE